MHDVNTKWYMTYIPTDLFPKVIMYCLYKYSCNSELRWMLYVFNVWFSFSLAPCALRDLSCFWWWEFTLLQLPLVQGMAVFLVREEDVTMQQYLCLRPFGSTGFTLIAEERVVWKPFGTTYPSTALIRSDGNSKMRHFYYERLPYLSR